MTIEERLAAVESMMAAITIDPANGGVTTGGNVAIEDGGRAPSNPLKLFLGNIALRGLYFFWQKRFEGQGSEYWGGFETWLNPGEGKPPGWGYGALPGRAWFMNFLLEANGVQVGQSVVVQRIYLQQPAHRNLETGAFEKAHRYDAQGVPFTAGGQVMGGIYPDYGDLVVRIERVGNEVWLFAPGGDVRLG